MYDAPPLSSGDESTVSQYFAIHPSHPQQRLVRRAAQIVRDGGLVVMPTDTLYCLGCHIGDRRALDRMRQIRQLSDRHLFTLICADLSELATYTRVDNSSYRVLKRYTPGPITFILQATREATRKLVNRKRKTLGIRVPDHPVCQALLAELEEPMLTTSLQMPGADYPVTDPETIRHSLDAQVDLIIDGGHCGTVPTTVVDLTDSVPEVLRPGAGELE